MQVTTFGGYQGRIANWMQECFGPTISADKDERNNRFLEESLELVQSLGMTREVAHQLVEYTYGRPLGDPIQEIGGVQVTLFALASANRLSVERASQLEADRIEQPHVMQRIREKQAAKPTFSPLAEVVRRWDTVVDPELVEMRAHRVYTNADSLAPSISHDDLRDIVSSNVPDATPVGINNVAAYRLTPDDLMKVCKHFHNLIISRSESES